MKKRYPAKMRHAWSAVLVSSWLACAPGASSSPPAGAPQRPTETTSTDAQAELPAHTLAFAPSPLDNPLKGFVPFYEKGKTYATKYPHSLEWSYFALSDLMSDYDKFDWSPIEAMLEEVANRGRQSVLRVYMEYPGKPSGVPEFLAKAGVKLRKVPQWNNEIPDYDDPRTIKALTSFIQAFGKKYD